MVVAFRGTETDSQGAASDILTDIYALQVRQNPWQPAIAVCRCSGRLLLLLLLLRLHPHRHLCAAADRHAGMVVQQLTCLGVAH
jgi:hypothetical protein